MDPLSRRIEQLSEQDEDPSVALAWRLAELDGGLGALRADVAVLRGELARVAVRMDESLTALGAAGAVPAAGPDLEPRLAVLEDTLDALAERVESAVRHAEGATVERLQDLAVAVAGLERTAALARPAAADPVGTLAPPGAGDHQAAATRADQAATRAAVEQLGDTVADALAVFAAALDRGLGSLAGAVTQAGREPGGPAGHQHLEQAGAGLGWPPGRHWSSGAT